MSEIWRVEGSEYLYQNHINGHLIEAKVSDVGPARQGGGGLKAEVSVLMDGVPLIRAQPTLTSVSGIKEFAREIEDERPEADYGIKWKRWMHMEIAARTIDAYRAGEPVINLGTVKPPSKISYTLEPYLIEGQVNILYGEGGNGKSTMAAWWAALCSTGHVDTSNGLTAKRTRVLYLDYETEESEIARRLEMIHAGMGIESKVDVEYRRCYRPLVAEANAILDFVSKMEIGLLIVDSLGMATAGTLSEEEAAVQYFGALRYLKTTSLTISHVNKAGQLFGSQYIHNAGRSIFELKRSSLAKNMIDVILLHRKVNPAGRESPHAYQIKFGDDTIEIVPKELLDTDLAAHELSVSELVLQIIDTEGPTAKAALPELVAEYKEITLDSVEGRKLLGATKTAISRHVRNQRLVDDGERLALPGAVATEADEWTTL
jgi:hypothetical protein